jgi:hypothetical protein
MSSGTDECGICLTAYGVKNPDGAAESRVIACCGHSFGSDCIRTYIDEACKEAKKIHEPVQIGCPLCRRDWTYNDCGHVIQPRCPKGAPAPLTNDAERPGVCHGCFFRRLKAYKKAQEMVLLLRANSEARDQRIRFAIGECNIAEAERLLRKNHKIRFEEIPWFQKARDEAMDYVLQLRAINGPADKRW